MATHRLENLDESLEKNVDGLVPGLREDVSWEEVGMPPKPPGWPRGLDLVCPEWKVDRSGTLRENCALAAAEAPPEAPPTPKERPVGERGNLLRKRERVENLTFASSEGRHTIRV